MKWIGGYTREEKIRQKESWHNWFAWYPVTIGLTLNNRRKVKVWLQFILKRGILSTCSNDPYIWSWDYKLKNKK